MTPIHSQSLAARRHSHDFLGADHDVNARRTRAAAILTALMMIVEIVAGKAYGSMALFADGVHMATHTAVLAAAAAAYAYSRAHAQDPRFSFGTGKIGDLAGFASALTLGIVSIGIAIESIQRLLNPGPVAFGEATVVAVIGLGVNLGCAVLLGGHHHHGHAHGNEHDHDDHDDHDHAHHDHPPTQRDNNLRSAYVHVLADALTSVAAIVALLAGRFLGWTWADPVIGLLGAVVIAQWAWTLMRDTALVLTDASKPALADAVRGAIEGDGDARIADLHVWQVGPGAHAAIVALVADRPHAAAVYHDRLIAIAGLTHVSVEVHPCASADCAGG